MLRDSENMRRLLVATAIVVGWIIFGCGGQTVEPMPDIPEKTIEYETVNLEYGDEDGVEKTKSQPARQAMVGETSELAGLSRRTVFSTNGLMYYVFWLKEKILEFRPREQHGDTYIWWGRPNDQYIRFRLKVTGEDSHDYKMWLGNSDSDKEVLFRGTFTRLGPKEKPQEGYGRLHFDFDTAHEYGDEKARGKMIVAFRTRGGVRQVNVAYDQFQGRGADEPIDAINTYVQLPEGRTQFEFFGRSDYERKSNEPQKDEFFSVDAAWLGDRRGRVAAKLEGGNLQESFRIDQCWDASETVVWEKRTAPFAGEGGEQSECADPLESLTMEPPTYEKPTGPPEIPGPHSSE